MRPNRARGLRSLGLAVAILLLLLPGLAPLRDRASRAATPIGPLRDPDAAVSALSLYLVTFSEVGLAGGTNWSVTFDGMSTNTTAPKIAYAVPNGTYPYLLANVSGYEILSAGSGSLSVDGANVSVVVSFAALHSVFLEETGLPSPAVWSLWWNGETIDVFGSSLVFSVRDGTYLFSVPQVGNYVPTPSVGNLTVADTNVYAAIHFSPVPPALLVLSSFTAAPGRAPVGTTVIFAVQFSGGVLPISFLYFGLPSNCTLPDAPQVQCTPTVPGTYSVTVLLSDALSQTASDTLSVVILPQSPPGGGNGASAAAPTVLGLPPLLGYAALAAAGVGIGALLYVPYRSARAARAPPSAVSPRTAARPRPLPPRRDPGKLK
jgi:hypothetical protein